MTLTAAGTGGTSSSAGTDGGSDDEGDASSTAATGSTGGGDPTGSGGPTGGSDVGTTADDAESSGEGPIGSGTLGECISVELWDSCNHYCSALEASCQLSGCDGGTVHYFGTGAECSRQTAPMIETHACDAPLQTNGTVSFARCCCA